MFVLLWIHKVHVNMMNYRRASGGTDHDSPLVLKPLTYYILCVVL